jgi:hypothetical protein
MGFGAGVFLLALGAILLFGAVDLPQSVDDVVATQTVGWILAAAGALSIVLGLFTVQRRSHTRVEEHRTEL